MAKKHYYMDEDGDRHEVPVIRNIHQAVLAAASQPGALNMTKWHTCETTHCRAGWVVKLAGKKGASLERASCASLAALEIYRASSPIPIKYNDFFASNAAALADMRRCADLEAAQERQS